MTLRRLWLAFALLLLAPALVALSADKELAGDPLPEGATARLGTGRLRAEWPRAARLTGDGKAVFASQGNGLVRHDLTGQRPPHRVTATGNLTAVSDDGARAAYVWFEGASVLDTAGAKQVAKITRRTTDGPHAAALSADGRVWAVGQQADRTDARARAGAVVWDTVANLERLALPGLYAFDCYVALAPDGKTLATWGNVPQEPDGAKNGPRKWAAQFWDVAAGRELSRFEWEGTASRRVVAVGPNRVAAVSVPPVLELLEVDTGKVRHRLATRAGLEPALAFSPDGATVGLVLSGAVQRWRVSDGARLSTTPAPARFGTDRSVHLRLPDNERGVVCRAARLAVVAWEVPSGAPLGAGPGHLAPLADGAFTPDGTHIITADADGVVLRWERATGKLVGAVPIPADWGYPPPPFALSPTGAYGFGSHDSSVTRLIDLADGAEQYALRFREAQNWQHRFSADGTKLISVGPEPAPPGEVAVVVWDVATGREIGQLKVRAPFPIESVAVAPDGKHVVLAGSHRDGPNRGQWGIAGWELKTGEQKGALDGKRLFGSLGVAAADATTAVAATPDARVAEFDFVTGRRGRVYETVGRPTPPILTPDGKTFAVACDEETPQGARSNIFVFERGTGGVRSRRVGPPGTRALALSADGKSLLTAQADGTALVWDVSK